MSDDLEEFPLAKAYDWRTPHIDTGGIFYVYPPEVMKKHRPGSNGVDADFMMIKRGRIDGLHPNEVMNLQYQECGAPQFNGVHRKKRR